jgi:23S rRNA (guanine2445-N2)-methyltransferase
MNLLSQRSTLQIVTPRHMPGYLRQELIALGYPILEETAMGVATEGSLEDAMRLNLYLRTAHRVLFFLDEIRVDSPEELYRKLRRFDWESYLYEDGYLSVSSYVDHPSITDSRFPNLKAKDAIVDRIDQKRGRRPDSGPDRTGAVVYLYWVGPSCSVYLDTSGESLSNRGYRKLAFRAPMQESLAAAVLLATGWNTRESLVNPMCGSGTLAIEAALMAVNRAPGSIRENFGFMHLRGWDPDVWDDLLQEARSAQRRPEARIVATDLDAEAIRVARRNAALAGVDRWIEFQRCDFTKTPVPPVPGVVILNPPYGERIGEAEQLEGLYRAIGDSFKQQYQGYRGYLLTGNPDLAKTVGLKAKRKVPFYNATIECRLMEYELYSGSRKHRTEAAD